jgi:hypothetical protein
MDRDLGDFPQEKDKNDIENEQKRLLSLGNLVLIDYVRSMIDLLLDYMSSMLKTVEKAKESARKSESDWEPNDASKFYENE